MSNAKLSEFGERLVSLSTTRQGLRAQLAIKSTPDKEDADLLHMMASNETLDRYDEVIEASGWQLDRYRRNPVIQNSHRYGDIMDTIGRAEKTEVINGSLVQVWRFASKENPIAKVARDLYRGKFLNASSVGFIPHEWEQGNHVTDYRRKYTKAELLEVSAVGIPANPDALALAYKSGCIEKSDLVELSQLLASTLRQVSSGKAAAPAQCDTGNLIENPYNAGEMIRVCGDEGAARRLEHQWEADAQRKAARQHDYLRNLSSVAEAVAQTLKRA